MPAGDTYNKAKVWVGAIIVYVDGGVIYWLDVAMAEELR